MEMIKAVATGQLKLLCLVLLLLGGAFRAVPANPAHACGCGTGLHGRAVLVQYSLVLAASTAAVLLFAVMTEVRMAEDAAARAAATARANVKVVAAAGLWLRGTLLSAVLLSFAASVLAVVAVEDVWFLHRTGCDACDAGYGAGSLPGVLTMGVFALVHGSFAWAAVTKN